MSFAYAKGSVPATLPEAEAFNPPIGDLNALIKRLAERLLPILGQQIRLRLFCTSGVFPVAMRPSGIEKILSRFFALAKAEMQTGGIVLIQTERQEVGGRYSTSKGGTASQIVVKLRYRIWGVEDAPAKSSAGVQSCCKLLGAVAQAVDQVVEEAHGFITLDYSPTDPAIRLHLPVVNQIDATDTTRRI